MKQSKRNCFSHQQGRLGGRLFVILPEAHDSFSQRGHWPASNLCVVPGTTHMMRKDHVPILMKECVMRHRLLLRSLFCIAGLASRIVTMSSPVSRRISG
ncbi:unnamed protein product [Nippostrongylus brasiliensis]|uniref:Uncharacterized protein n=1 Tax=Nippostrongylus brasiliensis TaxID=27835 RepID=A0A0N4YAB8_NIPBR|nr:unnamed protein product [Nippostrongylus brasiliensis]